MKSTNAETTQITEDVIVLQVTGMDCAACALTVENGVKNLDGVVNCRVNFAAETLTIQGAVPKERILARVTELGYGISEKTPAQQEPVVAEGFISFMRKRTDTRLAMLGALFILPGVLFNELLPGLGIESPWFNVLSLLALGLAGGPIARSAWRAIKINREININVLMTIAALGAVAIGAYTEAGMVMVLFAIGEALEGFTTNRARHSLRSLVATAPPKATVLRPCMDCQSHMGQAGYTGGPCPFCGTEPHLVGVETLLVGEIIVVKPGESIAMDGVVVSGQSHVNQAAITGESVLAPKNPGDRVFASSINGEGALEIKVTHLVEDSTLHRLIRLVEEAQENQAPSQRMVDRFARVYTPIVVAIAIATAVIPPLFFQAPFLNPSPSEQGWLYRALQLLVIACPCALVISTPVSIISAISNAARHGILFKGGSAIEVLSRVKAFAFDKTGTLTAGKPKVERVRSAQCITPGNGLSETGADCVPCDDLLSLAAAVEERSQHPLATAVMEAADLHRRGRKYPFADDVKILPGVGVTGSVGGRQILLGSHGYFDTHIPHDETVCQELDTAASDGHMPILVSIDEQYSGYITVVDQPRATSLNALAGLRSAGIQEFVMLTGDNRATAEVIGKKVGVTDIRANLLPEQKLQIIQELKQTHKTVGMVGDGVNDTPALAASSVGIALGAAGGGTAQAMETADIVLMSDQLDALTYAVWLSKAAMRTIKQNIWLSLGIKVVFLLLALLGMGTMWLAVFADMGTSLLVTLNGLRLLGYHPPISK